MRAAPLLQSGGVNLAVDGKSGEAPFIDEKTGSRFDVTGRGVAGELKGWTLKPVESVTCKWFAWAAEYPKTEIYLEKDSSPQGQSPPSKNPPISALIVDPAAVTPQQAAQWKAQGFNSLCVVLDGSPSFGDRLGRARTRPPARGVEGPRP